MPNHAQQINNIKVAVRSFEDIESVSFISKNYDNVQEQWEICVEIKLDLSNEFIPSTTRWWYIMPASYPYGRIRCFPDSLQGIKSTHNHQSYNIQLPDKKWTEGMLCLTEHFGLDRISLRNDPVGNREERLKWYIQRTIKWLTDAINGDLLKDGDPFELPDIYHHPEQPLKFAYCEGADSFERWKRLEQNYGLATISQLKNIDRYYIISEFKDWKGKTIISRWPPTTSERIVRSSIPCFWWLWDRPIVLPPWHPPLEWKQVREIGEKQDIDVENTLKRISNRIRDKGISFMLLGYPIPKYQGEANSEVHFDVIRMPILTSNIRPENGYRKNAKGFWMRERREVFGKKRKIEYMITENWHSDRLLARGRLSEKLRKIPTVIIGIGSLGSIVAEMLVRQGLESILLVDSDLLSAGNVVRHSLSLNDIWQRKTEVMKIKLESINPHVDVKTLDQELPADINIIHEIFSEYELVIDCTGSDDVIMLLGMTTFSMPKYFASFSLGYRAERLYAQTERSFGFSSDKFEEKHKHWKSIDIKELSKDDEMVEGAGCWSPLFPARYDDVVIAGSICVKILESLVTRVDAHVQYRVFKQLTQSGFCTGYEEVKETQ